MVCVSMLLTVYITLTRWFPTPISTAPCLGRRWAGTTELYNEVQFGSQLLLIDLRDEEEFKKGHVRSAINIPWSLMKGRELDAIEDELPSRFRRRRTNRVYAYDQVCLVPSVHERFLHTIEVMCDPRLY